VVTDYLHMNPEQAFVLSLHAQKKGPKKRHPNEPAPHGVRCGARKSLGRVELAPLHSAQTGDAVPPNFSSAPRLFQWGFSIRKRADQLFKKIVWCPQILSKLVNLESVIF